jgi:hypothetical protein
MTSQKKKKKALRSFETSVDIYLSIQYDIPEEEDTRSFETSVDIYL